MDCVFCSKDIEPQVITGNDLAFAVLNIEPLKDGHVMVLPRRHIKRLSELTTPEAKAVTDLTDKMVDVVDKLFGEAPSIHVNHGWHKSQAHLHVHILPSKGSLRDHFVAHEGVPYRNRQTVQYAKDMVEKIRGAM